MYKNRIYPAGLVLIFVLLLSCSIKDINDIANDPSPIKVKPWDYEITAPIYSKTFYIKDYYDRIPSISAPSTPPLSIPFFEWPTNPLVLPIPSTDFGNSNFINPNIDFDNNSTTDVIIKKIRSTDAKIILTFFLTNNGTPADLTIGSFSIVGALVVNGENYSFGTPTKNGLNVIYESTNFLSPANDYCIDSNNGNVTIGNSGPGGPSGLSFQFNDDGSTKYSSGPILNMKIDFNLGSTPEVIVEIPNDFNITQQSMPINSIPFIDTFKLDVDFGNELANDFQIFVDSTSYPFAAGNIGYSTLGKYYYASGTVVTNNSISIKKTGTDPVVRLVINKSKDFFQPLTGSSDIRLSRSGKISLKIIATGKTY